MLNRWKVIWYNCEQIRIRSTEEENNTSITKVQYFGAHSLNTEQTR